ncbi:Sporulation and spore germination [Pedococcus dokdonensis]|uniref:Sporulation and spore germination n=1 Tax=Pedococcus dokdonensis TaxID=443156 RepID=A0A1H0Q4N2_9MICO|nr:Gmad2 immunoglobulin-like domain-containing protein [Pedococcus dokdonensis]SDP12080.1 Sporulation and spore germination [Pedococcus dokdonensis]
MSDRTDFLHPDYEPGEFDVVERRLRQALARDAEQVRPSARLDTILHKAHELGPESATGGAATRRWLMPLAAAAAVAAIIGGVWWSGQEDGPTVTPPQTNGPSQTAPTTPPATTPTDGPTTSSPGDTETVSLPVYFVGPIGDATPTYRLFREFVRTPVPVGATAAERVKAALVLATNAQPYSNTDGYLQPWSGQTIGAVTVTQQAIEVQLSTPGAEGFDAETQRLAVQELVWTAQAAAQRTLPVRFELADGSTTLFGSISTDQDFTRPPSDRLYEDIAPIWVTAPGRDQVLSASKPVVVKGLAIVFEAHVNWQLKRGATQVATGFETASIGAPEQGTYSIALGKLAPGDYSIRVFAMSMEDGDKVAAEKTVSFTVK